VRPCSGSPSGSCSRSPARRTGSCRARPRTRNVGLLPTLALPLVALGLELAVLGGLPLGFALGLPLERWRERLELLVVPALIGLGVLATAHRIDVAPESPGAVVNELIRAARESCDSGVPSVELPVVHLNLNCKNGALSGSAPIGKGTFTARELEPSADLSRLGFEEIELFIPLGRTGTTLRVEAAEATVRGLRPWGRPHEVAGPMRIVSGFTAVLVACLTIALAGNYRSWARRLFVGAAASVSLVTAQLALDRGPSPWLGVLALSLIGMAGAWLAVVALGLAETLVFHLKSRGARRARRAIARAAGRW
jgi:hypothetical protein